MKKQLVTTKDGSSSIYIADLNEHYHSYHGAIQEAQHVFIKNGLNAYKSDNKKIRILEVGFGTGLNCLLTLINKQDCEIHYYGLEKFPLDSDLTNNLNYIKQLEAEKFKDAFKKMHSSSWNKKFELSQNFYLDKLNNTLQNIEFKKPFDIVYYDAFGPRAQSEMWEKPLFEKIYSAMNLEALFVTYCAKGQFKRDLKEIGFNVETLQGPPGKREMIRAIK